MDATLATRSPWRRVRPWLGVYAGIVALVAVAGGIVWNRFVVLPSYQIGDDFRATIPEAALSQIVSADVYFTLIGAAAGLILGITAWVMFRHLGWVVTLLALLGALVAALITREVGQVIGPRDFQARIANAAQGDLVSVDFTTHTWVPLAVWVGMAVLPVFVGSLFRRRTKIPRLPDDSLPAQTGTSPAERGG